MLLYGVTERIQKTKTMANIIIRPKSREDWLKERSTRIGGSEISAVVGMNPFESAYSLWRRKKGLDPAKTENFAMKAGHYLEDAVAQFYQDASGRSIIKRSAIDWLYVNREKPFLSGSPDRTFWLSGNKADGKGVLECKTTQKPIDAEDLPRHWFIQVQWNLGLAEMPLGSLAWLTQGREFGYKDIAFVPDFYGWLVEEGEKFYRDCIIGDREPEARCVADILTKFSRSAAETRALEEVFSGEPDKAEGIALACSEYKEIKDQISALEEKKDELEERIKMCFGEAEAISYGGLTLAIWKSAKDSEKFDAKAFAKDNPDLAAQYTKSVPGSRRFLVK